MNYKLLSKVLLGEIALCTVAMTLVVTLHGQQEQALFNGESLLKEINTITDQIDHTIEREIGNQEVLKAIFLVGKMGSGKSLLANFIAQKNIKIAPAGGIGARPLSVDDPIMHSEVRACANAVTSSPGMWYDRANKTVYCDCAGFGDPKDENLLRNACVLKYLLSKFSGKVVLALVSTIYSLDLQNNRAGEFTDAAKSIAAFFNANNAINGSHSLSLVITKTDRDYTAQEIKQAIKNILDNLRIALDQHSPLFGLFENISDRAIGFIPSTNRYPHLNVGMPFLADQEGNGVRQALVAALTQGVALPSNFNLNVSLSNAGRGYALLLAQKATNHLTTLVKQNLTKALVSNAKNIMNQKGKLAEKREKLKLVSQELDRCAENILELSPQQAMSQLDAPTVNEIKQIQRNLPLLRFLASILNNNEIMFGAEQIKNEINAIRNALTRVGQPPALETNGNQCTLYGFYSELSEIKQLLDTQNASRTQKISHVIIYLWNTLFFDTPETSLPGVTVCIIAPHWSVSQPTLLSLKGKDGNSVVTATNRAAGSDGQPGEAGQKGGDFFGACLRDNDLTSLRLDLSGGNGSNGTNGMDGEKGADAQHAQTIVTQGERERSNVEKLLAKKENQFVGISLKLEGSRLNYTSSPSGKSGTLYSRSTHQKMKTTNFSYTPETHTRVAVEGGQGTQGGKGGGGGPAAKKGTCKMLGGNINSIIVRDGKEGSPGKAGSGGKGGAGAPSLTAIAWKNLRWNRYHSKKDSDWKPLVPANSLLWKSHEEKAGTQGKNGSTPTELVLAQAAAPQESTEVITDGIKKNYLSKAQALDAHLKPFVEDLSDILS